MRCIQSLITNGKNFGKIPTKLQNFLFNFIHRIIPTNRRPYTVKIRLLTSVIGVKILNTGFMIVKVQCNFGGHFKNGRTLFQVNQI